MNNTFDEIKPAEKQNITIQVDHSDEFIQVAKQLGDFISSLPIDQPTNERLVGLLLDHVRVAEHDAVLQGFKTGVMYTLKKNEEKWNCGFRAMDNLMAKLREDSTKREKMMPKTQCVADI